VTSHPARHHGVIADGRGVCVLPVVTDIAGRHGLNTLLAAVVGSGASRPDLLRVSGFSALTENAVDSLPAYLAVEQSPQNPHTA
jgi:hypothetical protein